MNLYVLGFAFDMTGDRVALIRKTKPKWQAGKLNGIGGKVEADEMPRHAMTREFREETGVTIPSPHWTHFATLSGSDYMVHCFYVYEPVVPMKVATTTEEEVVVRDVATLDTRELLHNVRYLIDLAQDARNLAHGPQLLQYGHL